MMIWVTFKSASFSRQPGSGTVAHSGNPFHSAPKACFSKAFFQNAVLLKKEPSAAFCLKKKKKKKGKVFQNPQIPMSRVTQAQGDVNQMPSRLGLHQSLALKPTSWLPDQQKRNGQRVYVLKASPFVVLLLLLFLSPNIMKKVFFFLINLRVWVIRKNKQKQKQKVAQIRLSPCGHRRLMRSPPPLAINIGTAELSELTLSIPEIFPLCSSENGGRAHLSLPDTTVHLFCFSFYFLINLRLWGNCIN